LQHASPPQQLLSSRGATRVLPFRAVDPAVDALARREIEVAFVWGPIGGYRAARLGLLGEYKIVSTAGFGLRAPAAIGLRGADQALRERLDREMLELRGAV